MIGFSKIKWNNQKKKKKEVLKKKNIRKII